MAEPLEHISTNASEAEQIYVKWKTPAEELVSVARLAHEFEQREICDANKICIAVPNVAWAMQMKKAFDQIDASADLRIPNMPLSPAAKNGLGMLKMIACPEDEQLISAWAAAGRSEKERKQLVENYAEASAASLLRVTGLTRCPELEAALRHVNGEERVEDLYQLLLEQIAKPTAPHSFHIISILPYYQVEEEYEQLFLVSCVDGLIPGPFAFEAPNETARETACDQARKAFHHALSCGTKRVFISGFAKAPAEMAAKMHIQSARTKTEGGEKLAMVHPSMLLAELGTNRPSSLGGQALLRMYRLN